jgi:hypothetical protein
MTQADAFTGGSGLDPILVLYTHFGGIESAELRCAFASTIARGPLRSSVRQQFCRSRPESCPLLLNFVHQPSQRRSSFLQHEPRQRRHRIS